MVEHDGQVGEILAEIDRLGIRDNTIIVYSTDNGAEAFTWPDGGTTMFRGEKNTQFEGGYRVPMMVSWPGKFEPGTVNNEIGSHYDMFTTLLAAAGDTTSQEALLTGLAIGDTTFKSHLDGYNLLPALTEGAAWPRDSFIYWTDGGEVAALRYKNMKATFMVQEAEGLHVWIEPFTVLRAPILTNLRTDPFEMAHERGMDYDRWFMEHMFMIAPASAYIGQALQSFAEFPPRQKPGSFNLSAVMDMIMSGAQR
jgi:arylsulfatase